MIDSESLHTGHLRQITRGPAAHYPLYFFVPSHGANGRYMVVHRVADGDVQLLRVDLHSGESRVITDGHSQKCGWAIWSQEDATGIYDHLSCISQPRDEVYWFEDRDGELGACELWAAGIGSLSRRLLTHLPGRIPVGQGACSPDGRWLAIIHADHDTWRQGIIGRDRPLPDHEVWRARTPVVVGLIDLEGGSYRQLLTNHFHIHHLDFVDNRTLLFNHLPDGNGAWTMDISGDLASARVLRPPHDEVRICHQQITATGIHYEAFTSWTGDHTTWAGRCRWPDLMVEEVVLPLPGYTHTARDPAGRRAIFEVHSSEQHLLYALRRSQPGQPPDVQVLHRLADVPLPGQRYHAHPFIGPSGTQLFFTDCPDGIPQVFSLSVADVEDFWTQEFSLP